MNASNNTATMSHVRRRAAVLRAASGVDAILLYSPLVFKAVGVASDSAAIGATVAIGAVKTCFILVGMFLTDRVGRRPLLLASTRGRRGDHGLPPPDTPPGGHGRALRQVK